MENDEATVQFNLCVISEYVTRMNFDWISKVRIFKNIDGDIFREIKKCIMNKYVISTL